MASNVCWGIEVGAGAIKAIKLETDGSGVAVRDFAVINHPKVLSTPELDQADALRIALGTLANQYDLSKAVLAVSVPGHQSFARFAKLPPVEPKKVPDIVKFEAVQQIPFPLEEVEWDYQTFVSPDSPDIEVGIFAVTRARIMEQLSTVGEFGLTPEIATLGPVAAYNSLAYDLEFTEDTPGTIILDIGTTATDLIIAEAGRVWVRTFPLGGHQFTDALVTSFKLNYSKAERLKREAEQTKHARHVFQAMRPVFTDLVQEVQRSIGYYQSVHAGADLKRLIGMGNTFRLPGLRKYLKQQLQMDVYRIEGFKRLTAPEGREAEFNDASLNLCTAYGLALQGLDSAALRANVMPVPVVRETMWKQKRAWFGLAAGVAAAATAGWFVRPLMDNTAMNAVVPPSEIQRVANEGARLKQEAEAAGVLGDATGDTTASTLLSLVDGRGINTHLVNDVGVLLGDIRSAPIVAEEGATVRLAALKTEYMPPKESKSSGSSRGRDPFGMDPDPTGAGGGLIVMTPQPMMNLAPKRVVADAEFPEKIQWNGQEIDLAEKRRVNVTAEFVTDSEDAEEVAIKITEWLRREADRAGVPYLIALQKDDDKVYAQIDVPQAAPSGVPAGPGQGMMRRPGRDPGGAQSGLLITQPTRPTPGMAPGRRGGGAISVTGSDDPQTLINEMEKIAPIGPDTPVPAMGAQPARRVLGGASPASGGDDEQAETAYRVTFTLVLDKPAAPAAPEGGDS
jgi:type IV pilus assembly protein PilM